jgi:metal-responsive CopG/Arc/MetJ family transcriptional regulator
MSSQVNVKFQDEFYSTMLSISKKEGYMSVQEFIRGVVRDYINEELTKQEKMKINSIYTRNEKNKTWLPEKNVLDALRT